MIPISIPFNRPSFVGDELDRMAAAMTGGHISGDGRFTRACHELLERELGVARALLTTSCTHALEMAALLLDVGPGDEVILPSFTFVSTANAFVLRGAVPVFADIRPDTLNIDERLLPDLITDRTRAIIVVHYAGVACEMDDILSVARGRNVPVVEDNAHGLFGRYRGRMLGSLGALSTLSFHETKNFTCGEGGALLINEPGFIDRAEIIREKGTDRSRFFRGLVDRYGWTDIGSSYLPSDLLAAMLLAQLEARAEIQTARRRIWERYARDLSSWAAENDMRVPVVPEGIEQAYHMFYLLLPSLEARTALLTHLRDRGILAVFHYLPLHDSAMGQRLTRGGGRPCPVSRHVSDRLVRLPFYRSLTEADQTTVLEAVRAFHWTSSRAARTGVS
jgi:dTDP-4-amino-4,6-dideoxygalactose transaminase